MQIRKLKIENFRGIKSAELLLPKHAVLIGDNNTGKTTILEAIDLVLGPDRLSRVSPIDEHDFFEGKYSSLSKDDTKQSGANVVAVLEQVGDDTKADDEPDPSHQIKIEVTVIDLSEEQRSKFGDYAEWWDDNTNQFYDKANPVRILAKMNSDSGRT